MKKSSVVIGFLIVVLFAVYWFTKDSQVSVGIKKLTLPSYALDKVDRIEIQAKHNVRLFKEGQAWLLDIGTKEKPHLVRADQNNVKSLLDAALLIKPSHYVTSIKEKYKDLGLEDDDNEKITVFIYSENKPVWSLILGKNDNGSGKYAKLTDSDDVFVVRGSFWSLTRNNLDDWRDREIFSLKEGQATSVKIATLINTTLMNKDGEEWMLDRHEIKLPADFRENKSELSSLVRSILSMQAVGFVDQAKELSSPILSITVTGPELSETVSLFKGDKDEFLAKRSGNDQIYIINKFIIDRLTKPIDELRDLSLFKFDKATINKITLKSAGKNAIVEKKDGAWVIVEPKKLPNNFVFDPNSADDMLSMISGLYALRIASNKDVGQDKAWQKNWLAELINDKGDIVYIFADKNKAAKDEYVIKGNIDNNIYVIKSGKISSITQGIQGFKKEDFELPPINENTPGFGSLPVDVQRKLLDATKKKK